MTIKASGPSLSFTEIVNEFGNPADNKLGNYRVTFDNTPQGGSFSDLPLDAGIPQSGEIKFSDFYSKQLNIVVKGYGSGTAESWASKDAASAYDNGNVEVIGNPGKARPDRNDPAAWQDGKTVKINVNRTIGSSMPGTNENYRCALKTGEWPANTTLSVDVGSEGIITGAGGDGGDGGFGEDATAPAGENGSSALGIQYSPITVNVASGGVIQSGYGGGGGGGGAVRDTGKEGLDFYYGGGGGGGGAGYPSGLGGGGGTGRHGAGFKGNNGTTIDGGTGGAGGGAPWGGPGGRGGDEFLPAVNGDKGNGTGPVGGGGPGGGVGSAGDAIRATMPKAGNVNISVNEGGDIRGNKVYNVSPGTIT